MRVSKFNKESGMSKITLAFLIVFGGSAAYFGSQVINFYYCFYEVEGLMEFQAKKGEFLKDSEIRENLLERITKLEIPIDDPEDIKINRVDGNLIIGFKYVEVLSLDFKGKTYDLHVFPFNPHVSVSYK